MRKTLAEIKRVMNQHRDELRRTYKIRGISVFGSYVRKEQTKKSDIDLLAEFTEPVSLLDLIAAEQYLSGVLKTKVDLIPKDEIRPELRDVVLREAVAV